MGHLVVKTPLEKPQEIAARRAEHEYARTLEMRGHKPPAQALVGAEWARDQVVAMGEADPPIFADRREFPSKEDDYME